jgi:hypothetical protein
MPLRRNDTFHNAQFQMTVKVLDFVAGNRLKIEYTRGSHTEVFEIEADKLLRSILDETLFTKL